MLFLRFWLVLHLSFTCIRKRAGGGGKRERGRRRQAGGRRRPRSVTWSNAMQNRTDRRHHSYDDNVWPSHNATEGSRQAAKFIGSKVEMPAFGPVTHM